MNTENHYQETDLGNISLNPRGEYNPEESYEYLDLVVLEGGSYVCLAENGATITGISPESGKTTQYWQVITIPGSLTPEYIAMHDRVVNLSEQVGADAVEVRTAEQNVSGMELNVTQMQEQTRQSAEAAEQSKDSAAGYASSADTSRQAAEESEQNINAQITGFDVHVAEKTEEAENDIEAARIAANKAIIAQQEQSVNEVARAGIEAISTAQSAAQTATEKAQAAATSEKNAAASETAAKLSEANATKMAEQVATDKEQVAYDRTAVENAKQEMTGSVAQIEQNTQGISELKSDLDNLPIDLNYQYLKLSDLDPGKYYNWYSGSPSMSIIAHDAYSIYKTPIHVKSGQTINYENIDMAFTVVTTIDNKLIGKLNNLTGEMDGTGMYTVEQDCLVYVTHKNDNKPAMLTVDFEIPNEYTEGLISATFAPMSKKMFEMIKTGIGYNSLPVITVKKDGSGDYTNVVDAVNYANSLDVGADIYVYDGVYDILDELGGNTFLASVSHNGTFAERQGLRLSDNVNLYGVGRVIFNYLLPDTVTYVQSQCTSCINLYASNRIENIEFYAKNCRYACHDETNGGNPYIKRYVKNCRFVHYGNVDGLWKYPTVMGGGAGGGSQYDWVNCQFITTAYNQAFSYHTNYNQKPSKFNIDGCVGICMSEKGNSFRCSYHGTGQDGKTIFNFKNCSGNGRVIKQAETAGSTDHIEVYTNGYVQITDISVYA